MRVLVVDDSLLYRHALSRLIGSYDFVERVEVAATGDIALARARAGRPDVITLDLEMPGLDGLEVLRLLRQEKNTAAVVVVSSQTARGTRLAIKALELGAVDVLLKPGPDGSPSGINELDATLRALLGSLSLRPRPAAPAGITEGGAGARRERSDVEIVAIGASTGGPVALAELLSVLPADLPVPLVMVVHMPPGFTAQLASSLDRRCALTVREGAHACPLVPGEAYMAPGGRHMRVAKGSDGVVRLLLTDDPPENNCRPSVDYLFRSVAGLYRGRALGVILTGMGADGVRGLRLLKDHGSRVLAQDRESCVVFGMPGEAVAAGLVDELAPPGALGRLVARLAGGPGGAR